VRVPVSTCVVCAWAVSTPPLRYLRGLGHALQQPRDLSKAWLPFAEKALKDAGRLGEAQATVAAWTAHRKQGARAK